MPSARWPCRNASETGFETRTRAKCLAELLEILGAGGVDSTFVLHG
jgi:hypothetical protein